MFRAYAVQKAKKPPTKQKMFLKGTCQQPSLAEGLIHFGRLHEHALDLGCGVPNGISASPEHHSSYTQGGCARNVHSQHTPASQVHYSPCKRDFLDLRGPYEESLIF